MKLRVGQADTADVFGDMVRVNFRHRPDIPAGRICWVEMGGERVRAVARNTLGNETGSIYLDNVLRKKLGLKEGESYDFLFRRGSFWNEILWALGASDPINRVAARLAVLSVALGTVGATLGVVSLLK